MKYPIILVMTLLIMTTNLDSFSQKRGQQRIDSLLSVLSKSGEDTHKVNIYGVLSYEYSTIDPVKGIEFGEKGIELAEKLNWEKGLGSTYGCMAPNYQNTGNIEKALELYYKSLNVSRKYHDNWGIIANLTNLATIFCMQGKYDQALDYNNQALNIQEKLGDKEGMANTQGNMAGIYLEKGDPERALLYFRISLNTCTKIGDEKGMAMNYTNLGVLYKNRMEYKIAFDYFNKAMDIYNKSGMKAEKATVLMNTGDIYITSCDYPTAMEKYFEAIKISESLGDKLNMAYGYNGIGYMYTLQSDYEKALLYQNKALEIFKSLGANINSALNNIGVTYFNMKDYQSARDYFTQVLKGCEESGNNRLIASTYMNIGNTYTHTFYYAEALLYYQKSFDLTGEQGNKSFLAYLYGNMGICYNGMATDSLHRYTENYLPEYRNRKRNLKYSLEYLKKSVTLFHELGEKNTESTNLSALSETYEALGDYKNAMKAYKRSVEIKDSIFSLENKTKIANLDAKRETELKEKELIIYKTRNKQQRTIIVSGIGGFVLLILLIFIILRSLRNKRKANRLLEQKNQLITIQKNDIEQSHSIIKSDIDQAIVYVSSLLPAKINEKKINADWLFIPSSQLGGDAFGYHWIDSDHFAFYILDVCGHGIGSALHSVSVLHFIRQSIQLGIDPGNPDQMLNSLNNTFQSDNHNGLFFTMWYGVYHVSERRLHYICAGHPAPLVTDGYGNKILLEQSAVSVGCMPGYAYRVKTIELPLSASIYLFSDGAYEVNNSDGTPMLINQFYDIIVAGQTTSPENLHAIKEKVAAIQNSGEFADDFSLIRIDIGVE
jgi:sigma-B regulation protein RsbU (phosphoserine phosphatase)